MPEPHNEWPSTVLEEASTYARAVASYMEQALPGYLHDLETLVNMDSGTYDRDEVNRVGAWVRSRVERWGARVVHHDGGAYGDSFCATLGGTGMRHVVLLCHLDTVFPAGTARERPFCIADGRAFGPGVCDMKAGILAAIFAVEALREGGFGRFGSIRVIATSDEEVGAPSSRAFLEEMAAGADAVLVMEAGRENGDIVSQRKGGGSFRLDVRGVAAHAGVEPQKGRSAILTLSRQIVALHALTDYAAGTTVTVGHVSGGTRPNIVPDHALADVDVRAVTVQDMERLEAAIAAVLAQEAIEGTSFTWTPMTVRPPWGPHPGTERLVTCAQAVARALGFDVAAAATGGMSDGNLTAARGIPTLDGLGPVGGLDHSPQEYVEVASIVPRTALLAGIIAAIALR